MPSVPGSRERRDSLLFFGNDEHFEIVIRQRVLAAERTQVTAKDGPERGRW